MKDPGDLKRRIATVHLSFAILCVLLALPYLAAGVESWWQAQQFGVFGEVADPMRENARNAFVKGGLAALAAAYFFWRWRTQRRAPR